eukprot:c3752_g1_i1.p1 GENE.c3752_g1_i1~~c3752_g1_i1.p1  ORF type:complete len:196 (+),score=62.11 c3752_g1_i1:88-675(+)
MHVKSTITPTNEVHPTTEPITKENKSKHSFKLYAINFILSTLTMTIITVAHFVVLEEELKWTDLSMIIASFGASCSLICNAHKSPLAQPRNVILGQTISGFVGVCCQKAIGDTLGEGFSIPIAASLSILLMDLTRSFHPPAVATALQAILGGSSVYKVGFLFVFCPTFLGSCLLVLSAYVGNNYIAKRKYPSNWF